jgi:hypothetical protein
VAAITLNLDEVDSTQANGVAGTNGTVSVNCSDKFTYAIGLLLSGSPSGGTDRVAVQTMSTSDTVSRMHCFQRKPVDCRQAGRHR